MLSLQAQIWVSTGSYSFGRLSDKASCTMWALWPTSLVYIQENWRHQNWGYWWGRCVHARVPPSFCEWTGCCGISSYGSSGPSRSQTSPCNQLVNFISACWSFTYEVIAGSFKAWILELDVEWTKLPCNLEQFTAARLQNRWMLLQDALWFTSKWSKLSMLLHCLNFILAIFWLL